MTGASGQEFEQRFRAALAHLNAGRLQAASDAAAGLRRIAADHPGVLQLLATIALRADDPAEAGRLIERSLQLRPRHVPSLLIAARAATAAGAAGRAIDPLREVIALSPELADPAFLLCHALLDVGDGALETAIAHASARHPDCPAEWQGLGLALQRAGHTLLALTAFSKAAQANPRSSPAHFGRALLLREIGRLTEAQAALENAIALDPYASGAWFALGLTCQDLADEAGAAAAFAAALRTRQDFAEAAVNLGISLQRLGRMEDAIAAYRRAVQIRPDTLGRIAQALTSASTGVLWLDTGALRRTLGA